MLSLRLTNVTCFRTLDIFLWHAIVSLHLQIHRKRDARSLPLECGGGTLLMRLFAAHHHHSQMINKHKTLSRTPVISFCSALPLVAAQTSHNPSIAIFMDLNGTTLTSQPDNFISIKTQFGASILIMFGIQIIAILSSKKEAY